MTPTDREAAGANIREIVDNFREFIQDNEYLTSEQKETLVDELEESLNQVNRRYWETRDLSRVAWAASDKRLDNAKRMADIAIPATIGAVCFLGLCLLYLFGDFGWLGGAG